MKQLLPEKPKPGTRYRIAANIGGNGLHRLPMTLRRGVKGWTSISYGGTTAKLDREKGNRFELVVKDPSSPLGKITGNVFDTYREIVIDRLSPRKPARQR